MPLLTEREGEKLRTMSTQRLVEPLLVQFGVASKLTVDVMDCK